jgi:hypothetical protein
MAIQRGTNPERYIRYPRMRPFPQPTMKPGPSRNVQSLMAASGSHVAERKHFVLPSQYREHHHGGSDVGDDQKQLEENAQVDLVVVLSAAGDIAGRVVENGLEESECRDRREEPDEEEHAEYRAFLWSSATPASLGSSPEHTRTRRLKIKETPRFFLTMR